MNGIVIEKEKNGINREDFKSLAWVLRARAKDEMRPNLCGLHSDGMGKFAASDGHRLHIAEIPMLSEAIPAGIWQYVHASTKKISLMQAPEGVSPFPDFQKILIDNFNSKNPVNKGTLCHLKGETSGTVWRFHDMTGLHCNIDYLIDAVDGIEPVGIRIIPDDELSPVELTNADMRGNTKKAIVMPLKK